MKTITDGTTVSRVKDDVAEKKVKTGKFKYASKSDFKQAMKGEKR